MSLPMLGATLFCLALVLLLPVTVADDSWSVSSVVYEGGKYVLLVGSLLYVLVMVYFVNMIFFDGKSVGKKGSSEKGRPMLYPGRNLIIFKN